MFKIKDLMIKVMPGHGGFGGDAGWCGFCTGMDTCGGCTVQTCQWGCSTATKGFNPGETVINPPEYLALLKNQLKMQLAAVEQAEKQLSPQSVAEAEDLEKKLTDALAEVRNMKATLAKENR